MTDMTWNCSLPQGVRCPSLPSHSLPCPSLPVGDQDRRRSESPQYRLHTWPAGRGHHHGRQAGWSTLFQRPPCPPPSHSGVMAYYFPQFTFPPLQVVSVFSVGPGQSLLEEQRDRGGGPTTLLARTFTSRGMEVAMTVNGVNASSVFLRT